MAMLMACHVYQMSTTSVTVKELGQICQLCLVEGISITVGHINSGLV